MAGKKHHWLDVGMELKGTFARVAHALMHWFLCLKGGLYQYGLEPSANGPTLQMGLFVVSMV